MKKFTKLFFAIAIVMGILLPTQLSADTGTHPLYRYKQLPDGTYGYDESDPIKYYVGSPDTVEIPDVYVQEKEDFKSSWIATIFNIHMPQVDTEQEFKDAYINRLENMESWNMNAVIFQIRPLLDAFYPSEYNPTSEFLSGTQGVDVDYDPLAFMVEETHKKNMEFHAWLNPYRVTNTKITTPSVLNKIDLSAEDALVLTVPEHINALNRAGILADNNFAVLHPEWVQRFDEKLFLDPGIPEVIQHVVDTVNEIVTNYDVDAIHFDDYFYPYKVGTNMFGNDDRSTFETYGLTAGYEDTHLGLEAWRRDNVTTLISTLKDNLATHNTTTNSSVQLGVSPFGIWEHYNNNPLGSHTPLTSSQSYSNSIYADTYKWVKEELVDYMAPQIYWAFGTDAAPYGELARWWNDVAEGTHVQIYVGHPNYKFANAGFDNNFRNPEEIQNQMNFNQTLQNIKGSSLYSYNDTLKQDGSTPGIIAKNESIDILKSSAFATQSLPPAKPWLSNAPVQVPFNVQFEEGTMTWETHAEDTTRYFVVYEGELEQDPASIIAEATNIHSKIQRTDVTSYSFATVDETKQYVVTAVDKASVESAPGTLFVPTPDVWTVDVQSPTLSYPVGTVLSEQDIIAAVGVTSNLPATFTVDLTAFNLQTVGVHTPELVVTLVDPADYPEHTRTFPLEITITAIPGPEETTPVPEVPTNPTLPTTGDNSTSYAFLLSAILLIGGYAIIRKRAASLK